MCNLYSLTKGQDAIRQLARAMRDTTGNLPPMTGIYPDYPAPIVRTGADGVRELAMARWGMPTPPKFLEGKKVDKGVTNIRNVSSSHWRRWTAPSSRCVVPFTSFSEAARLPDGRSEPVWFAFDETRPLAVFAGVWTGWTCTRKLAEGEITCDLYAFLTTDPNREVGAVHPKAMPVIFTEPDDIRVELDRVESGDSLRADFMIQSAGWGWRPAWMGKPYSDDLRDRVVAAMIGGRSCRDVGSAFDVAPSTAGNWYRQYRRTSSYSPRPMGGDRRSKLTEHADWIAERLAAAPELTLGEVQGDLAERGVLVSYASVWRTVRRLGLRHKKKDDPRQRAGSARRRAGS